MPPKSPQQAISSILHESGDRTVLVVDIPRSIEEAQCLSGQVPSRRLLSVKPLAEPYPTPEPRNADARRHEQAPSALLADLMAGAAIENALAVLKESHTGLFCLPRVTSNQESLPDKEAIIPEKATYINGTIQEKLDEFVSTAPVFDLILLDPPWPNRSAKRKRGGYETFGGLTETRDLLSQIPVSSHLSATGLVAIWITNKPSLADLVTAPGSGLLAGWGLEVAAEWTWLKVTSHGEPLYPIDSTWRKPWERLIIARRIGSSVSVPDKVLLAVPDLHSRKPVLRDLFSGILPPGYRGLEVFARNLTAGWWSWGNEVLRFQQPECWTSADDVEHPERPSCSTDSAGSDE